MGLQLMIAGYVLFASVYVLGAFQLRPWVAIVEIEWNEDSALYLPIVRWSWLLAAVFLVFASEPAGVPTLATLIGIVAIAAVAIRYVPRLPGAESE